MNRLTDLLTNFGMSVLLHSLLVLGVVGFWTLRSPELRPMFQDGDVSLAVTFVTAVDDDSSTWSVERKALSGGRETTDPPAPTEALATFLRPPEQASQRREGEALAQEVRQMPDSAAEPPPEVLRQGVSGAVRMQSEIRPYYPLGARLRGEEGAVTVRVWVNDSGRALRCEVARSSGYPLLDEAAVDAARRARYVSTRPGTWRAEVETTLTFRFRLEE